MNSRDVDVAAAKRLLEHIRGALECLTADVINFQNALDGPPGMLAELADKVLDREWQVDGIDIRDFMPESAVTVTALETVHPEERSR